MADDNYLKTWVSDKLMLLMGYSKNVVVQYVIRLSKESPSSADLTRKLVEFGFSSSTETRSFAEEIYAKVPHKHTGPSNYQKAEKEAAQFAKQQRSYKLLDAADDDIDNNAMASHVASEAGKVGSHRN